MDTITNRPGGATDVGSFPAPTVDIEKNITGAHHNYIDKGAIHSRLELMAGELASEKEPEELTTCLLGLANELLLTLEGIQLIQIAPPGNDWYDDPSQEMPLHPPRLPPFPPLIALLRLSRKKQERLLDRRASELMREIMGLRDGFYVAPEYRQGYRMIEQARRRFRRLRDTAMKLGHWTDKRWEKGNEETHLV